MNSMVEVPSYKPGVCAADISSSSLAPPSISKLILDRLSFTVKLSLDHATYSSGRLEEEHEPYGHFSIKKNEAGWITGRLSLPCGQDGQGATGVHLEVNKKSLNNPYLRVDYNPSGIDSEGVAQLEEFLCGVTWFADMSEVLKNAVITRIDLARDIYGCSYNNWLFRASHFQKLTSTVKKKGMVHMVFGSSKGSSVCAYDKSASPSATPRTRVEYRYRKRTPICQLSGLPNLFSRVFVHNEAAFNAIGLPSKLHPMLLDSCRARGIDEAFKCWSSILTHPTKKKSLFKQTVWSEWLDTHHKWQDELVDALKEHGLYVLSSEE